MSQVKSLTQISTLGTRSEPRDPTQWVPVYTRVVILIGVLIIAVALLHLPADWIGFILFATLGAITELSSVELFESSKSRVSVSSIIVIASILLFGPFAGVLVHAVAGITTAVTTGLRSISSSKGRASLLERSAFNTGMFVIATFASGGMFIQLGGTIGNVALFSNILPLIGAAIADAFVNITILIGVIALQTRRRPLEIWKQDFQWTVPITILGGVIGGGVLAAAYQMFWLFGILVVFLPIISTSYSLRLYVMNTKVYLKRLERLNEDLDEANLGLLTSLGAVIDAYDVYTYGHSTQVARYGLALAECMNMPKEERDVLVKAALVHDIGKVGITESILSKPGPLTDEEFNLVKRHVIIGAEIVGQMKGLQALVPLIRHHHERWDGRGYPDGLAGAEIPLSARILTLSDTLDVLCSDRPYRRTLSFREVKEEIVRGSGTQFDPEIVKAFFSLVEQKGRDFFKNSAAAIDDIVVTEGNTGPRIAGILKGSMLAKERATEISAFWSREFDPEIG